MLIVLDLDDTIYLERDYVRSGFKAVGDWLETHRSFFNFFDEAWALFEEGERRTIFNKVLAPKGLYDDGLIKELVNVYRTHNPSIFLQSDAEDFLQKYPRDTLALITDGPSASQWAKIKVLRIEKYIGKIVVTDDLGPEYGKPNPEAFLNVQGALPGAACIYIADNPGKDFDAPARLGWEPSIRIRRTGSLHYDVPTPEGCKEAASFEEAIICESLDW